MMPTGSKVDYNILSYHKHFPYIDKLRNVSSQGKIPSCLLSKRFVQAFLTLYDITRRKKVLAL